MIKALILLTAIIFIAGGEAEADEIAIQTIAYEAAGEPFEGQVMVAKVIRNRMRERKQTAKQVCYAKHQFSCWRNRKPTQSRKLTDKELKTATEAWKAAKECDSKANLYCTSKIADKTYWTHSPKVQFLEIIGAHSFFFENR